VTFDWLPRSKSQWQTFTSARQEAARWWNDRVLGHARIRRMGWKFPSKARWEQWVKRRYPNLSAQTAQQVVAEFNEAVNSARPLGKNGHTEAKYPNGLLRYREVPYTNQDARVREGDLMVPNGSAGRLAARLPDGVELPGGLMEVRLTDGKSMAVCQVPDAPPAAKTTVGVDLGVNRLVAATDGETAGLVSGREAKATVQWPNQKLAGLVSKPSSHPRGSRRHQRLQRRQSKLLDNARNPIKDITHQATAKVQDAFPQALV
jgi:transposase